jgi:Tfp pilus assembly protein FimT
MAKRKNDRDIGFTLMEVIVMIIVAGLIAALAVPMMMQSDQGILREAARMLQADLQAVRNEAITRKESMTITFDTSADTYTVTDSSGSVITDPATRGNYVVDLGDELDEDIDITSAQFGNGAAVEFTKTGEPIQPGTTDTPVSEDNAIVLTLGDYTQTISLDQVTGDITVTEN